MEASLRTILLYVCIIAALTPCGSYIRRVVEAERGILVLHIHRITKLDGKRSDGYRGEPCSELLRANPWQCNIATAPPAQAKFIHNPARPVYIPPLLTRDPDSGIYNLLPRSCALSHGNAATNQSRHRRDDDGPKTYKLDHPILLPAYFSRSPPFAFQRCSLQISERRGSHQASTSSIHESNFRYTNTIDENRQFFKRKIKATLIMLIIFGVQGIPCEKYQIQ